MPSVGSEKVKSFLNQEINLEQLTQWATSVNQRSGSDEDGSKVIAQLIIRMGQDYGEFLLSPLGALVQELGENPDTAFHAIKLSRVSNRLALEYAGFFSAKPQA